MSRSVVATLCPDCTDLSEEDRQRALRDHAISTLRGREDTPSALGARGASQLLLGEPERAISHLQEAVRRAPRDAVLRSDLSAAYLGLAESGKRPYARLQALEWASSALRLDRLLPEALSNRALALEGLSLHRAAREQWETCLRVDPDSEWAAEARRRIRSLSAPSAEAVWEEARLDLRRAAGAGDATRVFAIVERFAMAARLHAEDQLLPEWGSAHLAGKPERAAAALAKGRSIGAALARLYGNHAVEDAVAAIERARMQPDRLAALAAGHRAYGSGREAFNLHRLDEARTDLGEASKALARGGSPFAASARLFHSAADYHSFEFSRASATLDRLAREVPLDRYPVLRGQRDWLVGVMRYEEGEATAALALHRSARSAFDQAHEAEYVAAAENLIALDLEYMGDVEEAWKHRYEALRRIGEVQAPKRQYQILLDTARAALAQGLPESALLFADETVAAAARWRSVPAVAESHWWRSRIRRVVGEREGALADLSQAKRATDEIEDAAMRRRIDGDVLLIEGEDLLAADPARAVDSLTRALASYEALGSGDFLAQVLLRRAEAYEKLDDLPRARGDLRRGIELYESRRLKIGDDGYRISYFDQSQEIFDAMIRLEVRLGEPASAFDHVERSRARTLLEQSEKEPLEDGAPWTLARIRSEMPAGVAIVEYAVLPDRVLAWMIRREGVELATLPIDVAGLASAVTGLRSRLERVEEAVPPPAVATRLYSALVEPFVTKLGPAEALVFIPDKNLHRLPFAALVNPATGRYLVEERTLTVAPSATLYLRSAQRGERLARGAPARALVIGNPALDATASPTLESLDEAEREAVEIAGLYGVSPLLGERATEATFLRSAPRHEVLHVAAHGLLNRDVPAWSKLMLAAEPGEPGDLHAWEIERLDLRQTRLAVLSACSAAGGAIWNNEGVSSLARAFLAAGVPAVVAPLWDVNDEEAAALMIELHRRLRRGLDPAAALRSAQISLLRGPDPKLRRPASWAGFQVIGAPSRRAEE